MNSGRQVGITAGQQQKCISKLSSGYRINQAADNAAGLSISEKMRAQIRGLDRASQNMQDSISLIQTAEGALSEVQSVVQRIRELSVQASNDTNVTADRTSIQDEITELVGEVTRISEQTEFNGMKLLNGNLEASTTAATPLVSLANHPEAYNLTLAEAVDSIGENEVGLIFTEESDYVTTQTNAGSSTSTAYGTDIMDTLETEIVPQAVQSLLDTYSGALGYLAGSSVGIGLKLYSDTTSTLAYVSCGATVGGSGSTLSFTLAVNVNSLNFTAGELTDDSREDLEATIAHEMVHAFMDESVTAGMLGYNGSTFVTAYPTWFKEGMAQTASGGSDWVKYGLGITAAATDAQIQSAFSGLTTNTNEANYATGYLACMYLGYLAGGGGTVNASTIAAGDDKILQSLVSGKSLDQTIADYTKYSGYTDFTTNLQNDTEAYDFVRNLMSAIGTGRGSIITGNLAETNILADASITDLALFKLNTTNDRVKNLYPSEVNVFSGGATTASGTKAVAEAPEAPPVGGTSGPSSTIINLSDLSNVDFANINGIEYDAGTNTITITGDGTFAFTGSNAGTNVVVNSGVKAKISAENIQCQEIILNAGSTLTLSGNAAANQISGAGTLVNTGTANMNMQGINVVNSGTITGDINSTGTNGISNTGTINGNAGCESGGVIENWGKITGTSTGNVKHYASSFTRNIIPPSKVSVGENLQGGDALTSTVSVNYNGTSTTLTGTWVVTDKDGNVVADPASITMQEGDSYSYALTFDGSPYDICFEANTKSALTEVSMAQTPDGGTISGTGGQLTYIYTVSPNTVSGGPTAGGGSAAQGGLNLQIGANQGQTMNLSIEGMSSADLGLDKVKTDTFQNAQTSITLCDNANKKVSEVRSRLGAYQNRLEHAISNTDNTHENLQAAESRIRDLDIEHEMVQYSIKSILLQSGQSMLAQANQQANSILSILQ